MMILYINLFMYKIIRSSPWTRHTPPTGPESLSAQLMLALRRCASRGNHSKVPHQVDLQPHPESLSLRNAI